MGSSGAEEQESPNPEFTECSAEAGKAVEGEGRTPGWGEGQDTRGAMGKVGEGEYRGGGGGGVGVEENG